MQAYNIGLSLLLFYSINEIELCEGGYIKEINITLEITRIWVSYLLLQQHKKHICIP